MTTHTLTIQFAGKDGSTMARAVLTDPDGKHHNPATEPRLSARAAEYDAMAWAARRGDTVAACTTSTACDRCPWAVTGVCEAGFFS